MGSRVSLRLASLVSLSVLAAACEGTVGHDVHRTDGGGGADAAMPGVDAGTRATDAGPPAVDSGPPAVDAGPPPVDAGPPPVDAGPPVLPPPSSLADATVLNSASDVASWPETTTITTLDLGIDGVYVDFTKRDGAASWPDVPFGAPGDSLEYTLWIVINVGGTWYTSGCIQYWRGLMRNGGPPSGYAMNWYYDTIRWGPMVGHQPAVGETVGFFVTAGNARNVTDGSGTIVNERSNVVYIPFPADPGAVFTY